VDVNREAREASGEPKQEPRSTSAFGRTVRFVLRHPVGVVQSIFFTLVAIVVLQNLEPTSIDVLFWSFRGLPKLIVILLSMLVGAAAWELVRRLLRR
jgi:uncharacterized integral membrane protein